MILSRKSAAYLLLCLNIAISAFSIYTAHFVKSPNLVIKFDFYLSAIIPLYLALTVLVIILINSNKDPAQNQDKESFWYNSGILLSLVVGIIYFSLWFLSSNYI